MTVYDIASRKKYNALPPERNTASDTLIICKESEVDSLCDVFEWDPDTTYECTNLDESVRFTSYEGYDFASVVCADFESGEIVQRELNMYFSKHYLVLVLPENEGKRLSELAYEIDKAVAAKTQRPLSLFYYLIWDNLAFDFSDVLEILENSMEDLAEEITKEAKNNHLSDIGKLKHAAYIQKKHLRALSYIGGQILIDDNHLLEKSNLHYFRSIDTRLQRLYDFADNLYSLSTQLLHTYDSTTSAKLNKNMGQLTVITLFFGPLTVITGIYGMNFSNMPELSWKAGYPLSIGLMAAVSLIVYLVMKKKKWL